MKYIVFILLFLLSNKLLYAQISIGSDYNYELYLPYSDYGKEYQTKYNNVSHIEWSGRLFYSGTLGSHGNRIGIGITSNNKNILIEDKIKGISIIKYDSFEEPVDTLYYESGFDLKIQSVSLGFYLDYSLFLKDFKNSQNFLGFSNSIFIYEKCVGEFIDKENLESKIEYEFINYVPSTQPSYLNTKKGFFFSSINLSTYYKHVWQLKHNFSIAARVSIGTNLYSEWDQFKKYVWLGAGLELGFGKPRSFGTEKNKGDKLE